MTLRERFEKFVSPEPTSGCWLWTGSLGSTGYGRLWDGRKYLRAHRIAWELHIGPIPPSLFVCHKCDVKACVNPEHLFIGDAFDNMGDAAKKGRLARGDKNWTRSRPERLLRGEANSSSKLRADQVTEIRLSNLSARLLAAKYGVVHSSILRARSRQTWGHL